MKIEFKDKTKKPIEFEHFPHKDKNLRKVNVSFGDGGTEGVWAVFQDKDLDKYDKDTTSGEVVVCLANSPICLLFNGWGLYIPVKFNGSSRPTCDFSLLAGKPLFCEEAIKAMEKEQAKKKKKAKKK